MREENLQVKRVDVFEVVVWVMSEFETDAIWLSQNAWNMAVSIAKPVMMV